MNFSETVPVPASVFDSMFIPHIFVVEHQLKAEIFVPMKFSLYIEELINPIFTYKLTEEELFRVKESVIAKHGIYSIEAKKIIEWDGVEKLYNKINRTGYHIFTFDIGGYYLIYDELMERKKDNKIVIVEHTSYVLQNNLSIELGDVVDIEWKMNQKAAVDLVKFHRCGIFKLMTGYGKTIIGIGIIEKLRKQTIIICPTTIILKQWINSLLKYFPYLVVRKQGAIYTLVYDNVIQIVVATSVAIKNVLDKREGSLYDFINYCPLLIYDEVHHAATEYNSRLISRLYGIEQLYGLSATVGTRSDRNDIAYQMKFGKILFEVNIFDVYEEKNIPVYFHPVQYTTLSNKYLPFHEKEKILIIYNNYRNDTINTLATLKRLEGRNVLILVDKIAHGSVLEKLIDKSVFIYGSIKMKTNNRIEELSKFGVEYNILISTYSFIREGYDNPNIDTIILSGFGKSFNKIVQSIGRMLRANSRTKKQPEIHDFADSHDALITHTQTRFGIYQNLKVYDIKAKNTILERFL
jgi:superfamily II DNA or RNA helicase